MVFVLAVFHSSTFSREIMAAIPPSPRFPASSFPSSPSGLLAVACALRFGHSIRLSCAGRLRLFCFHFQDAYRFKYLTRIKEFWFKGPSMLAIYSHLETIADAFSGSSLLSFPGKHSGKAFGTRRNLQIVTSEGNQFGGRLWTNVLLALNVLAYISQIATQGKLILWGAKINSLINEGQIWRLATCSFLHANIGHLMVNCYSLNSIGPTVERLSGPRRFLAVYFTSAIASSLMSYHFCQSPAVGASGAIFGLVGSAAVFALRHENLFKGAKQDMQQIARVIAVNMVIGFLSRGIDNWGHLGGLLGGAAMSWFLGPAWRFEFQTDSGRLVLTDQPPIFHLLNRTKTS